MSEQERQPTDNSERPRTAQGARRTSKEQTQQAITASSPAQEAAASVSASDPADSTAPQSPAPSHPLAPTGRGDGQCRRVSQDLRRQFEGIQDPVTTALVGANFVGLEQGSLRQAPYDALKAALQQRFHAKSELMKALEQLEAKPNSPGRRATLREEVVLELADHDTDFRTRAYDLLAKLPRSAWENLPGGYLEPENPDGRIDWTASYSALLLHIKGLFSSIYLTIISIIQGVALAYLAGSVDILGSQLTFTKAAMAVTALLMIITAWHEYMINTVTFTWLPSLLDTCVPFGIGAMEILVIQAINLGVSAWLITMFVLYVPHSAVWVWTNCDYFENRWVKSSKPRPIQDSNYKAELQQR